VLTSRADLGRKARAARLFLTVDDTAQAAELVELAQGRGGAPVQDVPSQGRIPRGPEPVWRAEEAVAGSSRRAPLPANP
jgi:membrane glycosyltransferase